MKLLNGISMVSFLLVFYPLSTFATPYLEENFHAGNNVFQYQDDLFNDTHHAPYANGKWVENRHCKGGLQLTLGNVDGQNILDGISGGWKGYFGMTDSSEVTVSIDYRLVMSQFDADECAQVLVQVDDGPVEAAAELCGRGKDTGWQTHTFVRSLSSGDHSLSIGGYINKKTGQRERADIYFDNFFVRDTAAIPDSCTINLKNNSHTCGNISAIDFILEPEDNKVVMRINLDPDESGFTEAIFDVQYENKDAGWTVNIGDSRSNNGYKGDGSDQSNDAEMQIVDGKMAVYGSDLNPEGNDPLFKFLEAINASSQIQFIVKNQFLGWSFEGLSGEHRSAFLYALDGQADTQGPVNYDIYAAFNRTIGSSYRSGYGVEMVKVQLKR